MALRLFGHYSKKQKCKYTVSQIKNVFTLMISVIHQRTHKSKDLEMGTVIKYTPLNQESVSLNPAGCRVFLLSVFSCGSIIRSLAEMQHFALLRS